ncbi:tRNA (adenine(22)-N(1))-methyltransferase [Clostridium butyricum]|jgi:tRNA (adenine22-N1)-methyltransferase|uniref:SAM-dependent methyltransferase n=1 Tax=Clostridium butyricum TaxID=1492 RepID=A0A512TM63_CLOBU|nr:class I SAM-dependent methyltransferase [Clostridium butyricum]MBS5982543.1 SAM-dependent methyltransferase [Clostridium butyricum]MDB2153657.1 class I SAM-dependent methyltransferase [Clostridium butyricum]NAS17920.1 SAM-dependent methyltransferase [Clostridium butyricum]NOW23070.1 tRNA (adenine22-N1)-methyltransferase [Clostridium butyricum]GEQ21068.1 SAM-dependent methyltransferase [Clostridium butyricum]
MELSKRLNWILNIMDKCDVIMDVGTDHGYIAIELIKRNLADKVIASDINKDPLNKAKLNVSLEGLSNKIELRLGGGLTPVKENEVNGVLIAGMGGNLIRDILENDIKKVKNMDYLVLQPAQNPEVLREYLYISDYEIIDEDVCFDEGKYYEVFKVKYKENNSTKLENIFYEVSPMLLNKKSDVFKDYLYEKIDKYKKVKSFIKDNTEHALSRKKELDSKIEIIENLLKKF